jgi:hypothetical protein
VNIRLVTNIPDKSIVRGIEDLVKSDRDLCSSKAGSKVAARATNGIYQFVTKLLGNLDELIFREDPKILGELYLVYEFLFHREKAYMEIGPSIKWTKYTRMVI